MMVQVAVPGIQITFQSVKRHKTIFHSIHTFQINGITPPPLADEDPTEEVSRIHRVK